MDVAAEVQAGSRRALARLITLLEREDPAGQTALAALGPGGKAHVVGVTGSPGTGKSTLVDRLVAEGRKRGLRCGVVAVDPSSPFTGGAILGDRIRMQRHATDDGVFIRSMGTRGALGGLSTHTLDAVRALDAVGYGLVVVETVGVGQAEVDVAKLADTVVVVLVPNLGDDVQAAKAGIMEVADVFALNKADLTGADRLAAQVQASMEVADAGPWTPPIVPTVAERGEGVPALWQAIADHRKWSEASGEWDRRRARRAREQVRELLQRDVVQHAFHRDGSPRQAYVRLIGEVEAGNLGAHQAAEAVLRAYRSSKQA